MSLIKKELTEKSGFVMEFSVSKEAFDKAENEAFEATLSTAKTEKERKKMKKHVSEWYNLRPVLGCAN